MEPMHSLAHDLIEGGSQHFRIATQPQRVLFWLADTAGACELVSGNWLGSTGQSVDEALGQGWLAVVEPDDRAALLQAVQLGTSTEQGFRWQYRLRRADGLTRWVLHDAAARFLPSGKFNGLVATLTDQSDDHAGALALAHTAQQVYDFLDGIALAAIVMGFDGRIVHCNQALATLCAEAGVDLRGQHWLDAYVAPAARAQVASLMDGLVAPAVLPAELEYPIETRDGSRLFRWHLTLIRGFDGQPLSIAMLGSDITRVRQVENHWRLSAQMFDSSHEAMVITDRNNLIVSVNNAFTTLTGYARDEAIGQNPRLLQSGRHDQAFYQAMWTGITGQGCWRGDIWDRRKDGSCYPKYLAISALRDEAGEVVNYSAIFYDITERKRLEDELDHLAHYDSLTGLPNRTLLQDRLEQVIASAERLDQPFALLFIDLDGFKLINDEAGHAVGDAVLQIVSQRLLAVIRGMDTAARLGGDEFVIVLTDIGQRENAAQAAEKIMATLTQPCQVAGLSLSVSASIGISLYPNDQRGADALLHSADEAMYQAKRGGKSQVRFYGNVR